MTQDWADVLAREWLDEPDPRRPDEWAASAASLAVLLRSVAKNTRYEEWQAMQNFRAEVRRVIWACDEILKRLESL